jgi:hypothetical protein
MTALLDVPLSRPPQLTPLISSARCLGCYQRGCPQGLNFSRVAGTQCRIYIKYLGQRGALHVLAGSLLQLGPPEARIHRRLHRFDADVKFSFRTFLLDDVAGAGRSNHAC